MAALSVDKRIVFFTLFSKATFAIFSEPIILVLTNLWIYRIRLNEDPKFLSEIANGKKPTYRF